MEKLIRTIRAVGMLVAVAATLLTPLHAEPEPTTLRVMSYNIHRGGVVMLKQPLSQTAKAIREAKADIVGIQETRSPRGDTLGDLAKLLGWNHDGQGGKGSQILTRYEIVESLKRGVKVRLDSGQEAYIFNLHLTSHPYQPYQLLGIRPKWHKHTFDIEFIKTEAEAIQWAKKARGDDLAELLKHIRLLPDKEAPVFVTGDFNEPSHLDWTEKAAEAGRHPIKVAYPNSLAMLKAGFGDAYRSIYPDEMKHPGLTWSPAYKPDDPATHQDRIDFVYYKGNGVKVTDVIIVGENKENADIVVSPYPSDHRAVVADFTLPSSPLPPPPSPAASSAEADVNQRAGFGLEVTTYALGSGPATFDGTLHIAFGPGPQEIVTDSHNDRFLYRASAKDPFQISPIPLKGQHSVVYNPKDGLYYANDTGNHRIISFADLSKRTITAETKTIAGIPLKRPHDIVADPATGWIYAINPNSGHVFRFTAIGENETAISVPVNGYARALTFTDGNLYVIGSAKGRIVEVVDWDTPTFKSFDSFDPTGKHGPAGSWTQTGLVLNDAEFFDGFWYATSYFTPSYARGSDFDEHKFIRFKTLDDLVEGKWTDLSRLIPTGMTPYYLSVNRGKLYLAIFNHESHGGGDSILQLTHLNPSLKNEKLNKGLKGTR